MGRPRRCDGAGCWHHVLNRGLARRPVFETRDDVRAFLAELALSVRRGEIEVHAWVVLTTHYHLLVRSVDGGLSAAMRRVHSSFVRRFNRRRGRDGPLFRGRFTSLLIENDAYWRAVLRYIDENPVRAGLVKAAPDWPDGSAAQYVRGRGTPWLERAEVERALRGALGSARFDGSRYAEALPLLAPRTSDELVRARLRNPLLREGPIDELGRASRPAVEMWLAARAILADGRHQSPLVVPSGLLLAALGSERAKRPGWRIRTEPGWSDAWSLLEAGLLHAASGLGKAGAARLLGLGVSAAQRRIERHARALERDEDYRRVAASLMRATLDAQAIASPATARL